MDVKGYATNIIFFNLVHIHFCKGCYWTFHIASNVCSNYPTFQPVESSAVFKRISLISSLN